MAGSGQQQDPLAAGFMDDYFAEAEEHIMAVRRSLLQLESAPDGKVPPAVLEDLYRSIHSLKGISAMVDLREAELLAHETESCLRGLRQGVVALTPATVETLDDAAKLLEHIVLAHRGGRPIPAVDHLITRLEALATHDGRGQENTPPPQTERREAASERRWKVSFTPSAELVARGVKVDTVRGRLLQIGAVLNVAPKVLPGAGVSFVFDVETDQEEQLAAWRDDGLTYEPLLTSAAPDAPTIEPGAPPEQQPDRLHELSSAAPTNFVRVDLARLDELMRLVGDMVVTRARLDDTLQRLERHVPFQEWRTLQEHNSGLERQLRDLREGVMRVRLVPVGEIFRRMPFVVRDLARDNGKRVRLEVAGQGTEIDKFLIERMMDPVLHLVRNAISHAIETPEQRLAAGKPAEGTIRLSASTAGESVVLEITDDGSGIDAPAVFARARAGGMALPDGPLDSRTVLDIICASGFSTRQEADRASGRGVGMAVVRGTVEDLGGALAMETAPGRGTTFRITLPLTLAITDAIIVHVGAHVFAVPQAGVREVIEVDASAIRSIEANELLVYRGATLPVVQLATLFSIAAANRARFHAVVVGTGAAAVGLLVDRIAGQREIVVKAINDPLIRVRGVSGATELGDGRLVLILDVSALSRSLRGTSRAPDERSA
jgi:two-component system, chemotaxis family, sensor kinase CheA